MSIPILTFNFDPDFSTCENGAPRRTAIFTMPPLSAYNEGTEGWRIHRLASTWGQACAAVNLLSNRYQHHWEGAIVALGDSKGTLEVTWRDEQSRIIFEGVIMGAWEREGDHAGAHALATEETKIG